MIDAAIVRVLLEASLRVCFVALAVATVLKLARVEASAVRHAAWASVVVAMLLMPLLPYVLPSFEWPGRGRVALTVAALPDDLPYVGDVDLQGPLNATAVMPPRPNPAIGTSAAVLAASRGADTRGIGSWFASMPLWVVAALAIYAIGLGMLLVRWALAARFLAKLRRQSTPIATSVPANVFESALAATPITVGALKPWIVLPTEWKTWSASKLAGVLAHERAHVDRHDPLFALVAYVNRCIFWFHPLAWWLERKLASTAEDAADDAGAKAMGQEREYAEVLVEMATVVRRHGGRVAWQGVGVDGNGLLSKRIDRLLGGEVFREVSPMKKALVALVSIAAVFIAVACRGPVELRPDPKVAAQMATNKIRWSNADQDRASAQAQVETLKAALSKNPDDMATLEKLLTAYGLDFSGRPNPKAAEYTAARRPYILRLIKDHPESALAGSWGARIFPSPRDPLADPAGYAEGRALWLERMRKPDAPAAVLKNAAGWLEANDKPLAEEALQRLAKIDAKNASNRLGRLYALALVGSNASMPLNVVRSNDPAEAASPFATYARKVLAETKDVDLLTSTCRTLYWDTSSAKGLAVDQRGEALAYCDHALALDPANEQANAVRFADSDRARNQRQRDVLKGVDPTERYAKISALPEAEQLPVMGSLAATSWYQAVDLQYNKHDQTAADAQWKQARQFADAAIRLALKMSDHPEAADQLYQAKTVLAALAIHDGIRKDAVRFLTEAAAAPRTNTRAPMDSVEDAVVHQLLKAGERESIIAFYDKVAAIPGMGQQYAKASAAALRAGTMPMRYQYFLDREVNPPKLR